MNSQKKRVHMHSFLRERDVTTVIWLWVIVDGVYVEISGKVIVSRVSGTSGG